MGGATVQDIIYKHLEKNGTLDKIAKENQEKGVGEGVDISADIIRALIRKEPVEKIAAQYQVPVEKVKEKNGTLDSVRGEGVGEGVDISADIIRELIRKEPIEKIAAQYQVPVEKVEKLQSSLTLNLA